MDSATQHHVSSLKDCLLTLKDSGPDGFEGLLAAVLAEICGQPFRLAASGSQRGRDGDSAFDAGAIYFETKLYTGDVSVSAVSRKILDLSNDDEGQVDTWILCATSAISAQHSELYRNMLAKWGIGCLILDWSDDILPPLATLLAMAAATTAQFLNDHGIDKSKLSDLRAHLDAIARDASYPVFSEHINSLVRDPALALAIAKAANRAWLLETFSSRAAARQRLGQPLAPLDQSGLRWADRPDLIRQLASAFSGSPEKLVLTVIGEEGTGKSWLTAKGWLASNPSTLLAVFTADEMISPTGDLEETIINKLVSQTGGTLSDSLKRRWQRRFCGWRANPTPQNIRLTVWIDGLNQAQDFPWSRWIPGAAEFLSKIGARLVITTNEHHFARIRNAIDARRVIVVEWSEAELRTILTLNRISSDRLSADVFDFLRNPRILGIAYELLDIRAIEQFEELTVGRLVFEHIHRCERDHTSNLSVDAFVTGLRDHARLIIDRLSGQQHDDLKVFGSQLDARLKAVSDSRFFEPVPGEPDLYEIKDEGLPLALGLALLSDLRREERNNRDPAARLSEIVEPITALATTSEVIFSALQVACLESNGSEAIQAALARYYISLQNVPDEHWSAFEALARVAPGGFVRAAQDSALSRLHLPNVRWLTAALLSAQDDPNALHKSVNEALAWLSRYSLAPERGMFRRAGQDTREQVQAERTKRRGEIEASLEALSPAERNFVETRLARTDDTDLSQLHELAFELVSGKPLAPAADALVNWAFTNALNADIHAPWKQLAHLVTFNVVDPRETRDALLHACAPFLAPGTSPTGEWAAVTILRATGHSDDATRADAIADRLTRDHPKFSFEPDRFLSFTDPCNPHSVTPANLNDAVSAYERLDVSHLRQGRGGTAEDHFFSRGLPGVARFQRSAAIAVQQRFSRDVVRRDGLGRRQGMFSLVPASACLEPEVVDRLIEAALVVTAERDGSDSDKNDAWLTAQYALVTALPHKSGNEQLATMAAMPGRLLLVRLLEQVTAADEAAVELHLERALQSPDPDEKARTLAFIKYSQSPLSPRSRGLLPGFLSSPDSLVRTQALGIVAALRDEGLLRQVVASDWDAKAIDAKKAHYERWYGSSALLAAAEMGFIDPADAIDRMTLGFYGFAAARLGQAGIDETGIRIDAALRRAADLQSIPEFPRIEQPLASGPEQEPPRLSLASDEPAPSNIRQAFERLGESDEAFQARQRRAWNAFGRFSRELSMADARIILDDFSWSGFDAIVGAKPAIAKSWADLLMALPVRSFRWLHSFALGLARSISTIDVATSRSLFQRLAHSEPFVNQVIGVARIPAEAAAVWSAADMPEIKAVCFERLDAAANDHDLAVEVLAAFHVSKGTLIAEYVDAKLAIGNPAPVARALMVSGFSDENAHATEVLARFKGYAGFIGYACAAGQYAYERNVWSRHWYDRMKSARTREEFWQYSVLLTKIVDARYPLWEASYGPPSEAFERFFLTIDELIEKRIEKWQNARKKKLFGQDVPDPIFLGLPH